MGKLLTPNKYYVIFKQEPYGKHAMGGGVKSPKKRAKNDTSIELVDKHDLMVCESCIE